MNESYLKADNLAIGYHKKPIISGIHLDIRKGEIIALIGPNGAGKSTLLKTFVRDLDILRGSIYLDGKNLLSYSYKELSRKMAVILTDRIKVEMMTCKDIVATGRYPYTGHLGILSKEDEEKTNAALEAVNAADLAFRDFGAISDGQRQRILLARALCQEPEIILLDEPTSFLDIRHKLELLTLLTKLAREKNITVIMSLHEIDLAEKTADRIISIDANRAVAFGSPAEVFTESNIKKLYSIDNGYFDPLFGNIELRKPDGETPKVFVISGGGEGIPIYRKLQQENIPFAAGVLFENDLDFQLARLLATNVISTEAFSPVPEHITQQACKVMLSCEKVILAGPMAERANPTLVREAKQCGKLNIK